MQQKNLFERIETILLFNIYREENYQTISIFFDLAGTGLSNMDIDYTKQLVDTLKYYYPNNLNYIFVFELPWILNGRFVRIVQFI